MEGREKGGEEEGGEEEGGEKEGGEREGLVQGSNQDMKSLTLAASGQRREFLAPAAKPKPFALLHLFVCRRIR